MINIVKYTKPKNSSTNSIISSVGAVTSNNNASVTVDTALSPTSENAVQNKAIYKALLGFIQAIANTDGTLQLSNSGSTIIINSNTWKIVNGHLQYIGDVEVSGISATNGDITNLSGTNLNYEDATIENLTVTKAAHFFQLIIDEIKSTQGQVIITAANAKLDLVEQSQTGFKCYWKNTDGDKTIYNQFEVNDQVICQTFNLDDSSGTHQTNKFYWSKIISVGTETKNGEPCNYIVLSTQDYDTRSNGTPQVGDEIVQLGNKTNTDRQAAIIISAYNNQFLDPTIQAPSIVQYSGINDYNLSTHRLNVISKGLNQFNGNFSTTAGDIQSQINNNKKRYFPIIKPMYSYTFDLITDYLNNPIRYKGDLDIYSTPTYVEQGIYKVRIFVNSVSLGNSYSIASYGNTFPSDLGSYDPIQTFSLVRGTSSIKAKDNTTLYEFVGEVTITTSGYYGFNWWESYYMYIPEDTNEFESNYSRITQTNTRITSEVGTINGEISRIDQKADSIELAVDETNVRLDNGQFTINADTTVNGNLTIKNAQEGFILNSANGNTYIIGDSIGTFEQFKSRTYVTNYYNSTTVSSSDSTTIRFNSTLDFGKLPINTTLDFINFSCIVRRMDNVPMVLDSWSYQITLYKDGSVVHAISGNGDGNPSVGLSYTTNATVGNYVAEIMWIATTVNSTSNPQKSSTIYFQTKVYTSTFNLIGTDGIGSNFGVNKTFYVGNEATYIRYTDDNVLKISTDGIQKYAGSTLYKQQDKGFATDSCNSKYWSEYSPINGVAVRVVTGVTANPARCYLQPNDEMILFKLTNAANGVTCHFNLETPSLSNVGRKVYLKKMTDYGNIYVWGDNTGSTTQYIRTGDGNTTNYQEIDYRSRYYISDGAYWIEYYCG